MLISKCVYYTTRQYNKPPWGQWFYLLHWSTFNTEPSLLNQKCESKEREKKKSCFLKTPPLLPVHLHRYLRPYVSHIGTLIRKCAIAIVPSVGSWIHGTSFQWRCCKYHLLVLHTRKNLRLDRLYNLLSAWLYPHNSLRLQAIIEKMPLF